MEHVRKMIFIPEESINNLHQHFSSEKTGYHVNTWHTYIATRQRNEWNYKFDINSRWSWKICNVLTSIGAFYVLWKKWWYKKVSSECVNTPGDTDKVTRVNRDEDTNEENSNESIIHCVPQKFKFKAKMLLQRLHDFGDITWDDRGKITIDGSTAKVEI